MLELLEDLERWRTSGEEVVLARVIDVDGSGPRLSGAAMAVTRRGEVVGSVSGGCVEAAVVSEALDLMERGPSATRQCTFGYSDADAIAVGLTCGGTVRLFLEIVDSSPVLDAIREASTGHEGVALLTIIDGPSAGAKAAVTSTGQVVGSLGSGELDRVAARDALDELGTGRNAIRKYDQRGEARESTVAVFIESFAPSPRMIIFGAVDFTAALAVAAKPLGFHVIVCDAREVFTTEARFPMADEVVVDWPHRYLEAVAASGAPLGALDAVCVLTHDHKFDVPAIVAAAQTDVGYLGAMGSRRTHAERVERLRSEGMTEGQLQRVMAPIGLDLGARTPQETAIAICAEIVALRTGRTGSSLRVTTGHIH